MKNQVFLPARHSGNIEVSESDKLVMISVLDLGTDISTEYIHVPYFNSVQLSFNSLEGFHVL